MHDMKFVQHVVLRVLDKNEGVFVTIHSGKCDRLVDRYQGGLLIIVPVAK